MKSVKDQSKKQIESGNAVMNKKKLLIGCSAISIMLIALAFYFISNINSEYTIVATIDGNPVYEREFKERLQSNSSQVFNYFNKKYGATDSEDFWSKDFNGEIPAECARKKALEDCVAIKVQQSLAEEKGIIKSSSYKDFLKELDKENKRRNEAIRKGQVIYGPEQYGETEYFSYVLSNMVINLQKAMKDEELKVEESELKQFYEKNKAKRYKVQDSVKVQKISIQYLDKDGSYHEDLEKKAEEKINDAKLRLDKGESFENVAKQYNEGGKMKEQSFEPEDAKQNLTNYPELLEAALNLKVGEISPVIKTNMDFMIIKCIDKKVMGFEPYEEVKDTIKSELVGEKYNEFIEKRVKAAKVVINEKVYDKINVR